MAACNECKGSGKLSCSECDGEGCEWCDWDGTESCHACGGEGMVEDDDDQLEELDPDNLTGRR